MALSAQGNFNTKITNDWTVFLNGNVRYNRVENKFLSGQSNSGFSGNANLNTSYSFSKKFNVSSYAGFFRAPVTIQTRSRTSLIRAVDARSIARIFDVRSMRNDFPLNSIVG